MDTVTDAQVAVTLTVPASPEQMWDRITAVSRIGEWSPEATGAQWCGSGPAAVPGAGFTGHNRFPNGLVTTVTCVVIEADRPHSFAWTVLDDAGQVSSTWRYELRDGRTPGSAVVRHSFTHGAGHSGMRTNADADPGTLQDRLATICRNMAVTVTAMGSSGQDPSPVTRS
ncbi:SRPBCC family protein [Actinoplanes sp. N902-109]|uniref:SRPBCC family protein n=1 Tax=Actinoplanes sp. (strain N902-109) TaxID=649831 RepID=UPI0003296732|nr:SRPBCC family protein [Actinoplanes sp. N902-109]AGL15888.1 hypothetical protein L083_2378 [Actinoplanes sp. N902-109]